MVTLAVVVEQALVELELLLELLVNAPVNVGVQVLPHPTNVNIQTPSSAHEGARPILISPGATREAARSRRGYCSGRRQ
jgi:hypothetical protein